MERPSPTVGGTCAGQTVWSSAALQWACPPIKGLAEGDNWGAAIAHFSRDGISIALAFLTIRSLESLAETPASAGRQCGYVSLNWVPHQTTRDDRGRFTQGQGNIAAELVSKQIIDLLESGPGGPSER